MKLQAQSGYFQQNWQFSSGTASHGLPASVQRPAEMRTQPTSAQPAGALAENPLLALAELAQWQRGDESAGDSQVRWALERMPLRVAIAPMPGGAIASSAGHVDEPSGADGEFQANDGEREAASQRAFLFSAFRQWEAASGGLLRFRLLEMPSPKALYSDTAFHTSNAETRQADTASPEVRQHPPEENTADITVIWSRDTVRGRDFEVGHAHRTVKNQQIVQATITLIQEPVIDGYLSAEKQRKRLFATMLHEAGHALGLEHSEQKGDVMYYRGWERTYLSDNDVRRLQALYQPARPLFLG